MGLEIPIPMRMGWEWIRFSHMESYMDPRMESHMDPHMESYMEPHMESHDSHVITNGSPIEFSHQQIDY